MSDGSDSLFDDLQPPRGGLLGLRVRLERAERRAARLRLARVATAGAALAAVLLMLVPGNPPKPRQLDVGPGAVRLGLREAPLEPVSVIGAQGADHAVQRVPLPIDRVVLYLVGTSAPDTEEPQTDG